ncbi:MAG TPA: acyl-homoserine-lactone synthase [Paracoccaceae bacterium]|nr:acyl-homoserine-lactone synthase [Paracoccaceae bacterium]
MIHFIHADELVRYPLLGATMFRDRTAQFRDRLSWNVTVDARGFERDEYDDENPIYVIWALPDGTHGGSMRILPTTGRTMVNDHFVHLNGGVEIVSPLIWECTRFCLSPRLMGGMHAAKPISAALMLAGCELGIRFGLTHAVGVFDARMTRIYRAVGWSPEILGTEGEGTASVSTGLWPIDAEARAAIAARSGLAETLAAEWFELAFGAHPAADPVLYAAE